MADKVANVGLTDLITGESERIDDSYVLRRRFSEKKDLDDWMNSQIELTKKERPSEKVVPIEQASEEYKKAHPGVGEEKGLIQPGKDPEKSFIENTLLSLTDPVEWVSLAGGGAWQAARMGKPLIAGAIDWATLGIPSLAKGGKGFVKGITEGLGAKAKEIAKPIKGGIAGATPEMRIGAETIKEGTQPTVAKLATVEGEKIASGLNKKIEETSGKIIKLAEDWEGIVEKARRGTISHEEAIAKGKELGMGVDDVKKLYPGTPMNAEQASALVGVIRPVADDSINAAKKYVQTRKPEDLHEALYKFYSLMEIDPKRFGVIAEAGRTLSQLNEPISGVNQYLNQFSRAMSELVPEGLTPERLIQLIAHFNSPEQLAVMARHVAKPGSMKAWGEALMEGWVMGLLTGIKTHAVNFTSNTLTAIMGPTERALAARLSFGEGKHVVKGEATEMVYGMINGFMDGLSIFKKSFKTGVSQFGTEKVEYIGKKAISAEALNLSGTFGRAADLLGEAIRVPGKALVAADDMFKLINYRGNMRAMALREGTEKGLGRNTVDMANFIDDFMKSPSTKALEQSKEYANYMTFTKELDGLAGSVQKVLENHPFLRVVIPFWRTPVNIFKFSLERTPLLNALSGQLRADITAGGVRRDMAMGKIALGSMVAMTAYTLARAGYITGGGPSDKNLRNIQRQAGWQPDSLKIGDIYYSYSRVDPMSTFLGIMADLAEVSDELDQPTLDQYTMAIVLGFMNHMTTKSYLTGISNIFEAMKEPDKQGTDYIKQWTRSLVPTIVRQTEQMVDPTIRETTGFFDNIKAGVPGWSSTLPAKRDLKGEPMVSEGALGPDLFSFIFQSTQKKDPVWRELVENKVSISPVPKIMGGPKVPKSIMGQETSVNGVELTPKEYDWIQRMAGNELKVDGKGMWDTLTHMIQTPEYKKSSGGSEGMKSLLIKTVVNKYRELAFAKMREINPELNNLLTKKEIERIKSKLPGGER